MSGSCELESKITNHQATQLPSIPSDNLLAQNSDTNVQASLPQISFPGSPEPTSQSSTTSTPISTDTPTLNTPSCLQDHTINPASATLSIAQSLKTTFAHQTSPRLGSTSPSGPAGSMFINDLQVINQNTFSSGLKAWKADKRQATPYPKPQGEDYEFEQPGEQDSSNEETEDLTEDCE